MVSAKFQFVLLYFTVDLFVIALISCIFRDVKWKNIWIDRFIFVKWWILFAIFKFADMLILQILMYYETKLAAHKTPSNWFMCYWNFAERDFCALYSARIPCFLQVTWTVLCTSVVLQCMTMGESSNAKLPLDRVSLCGVTSLCDVLPQLSFPSPLPSTQEKSLLFRYHISGKEISCVLSGHR